MVAAEDDARKGGCARVVGGSVSDSMGLVVSARARALTLVTSLALCVLVVVAVRLRDLDAAVHDVFEDVVDEAHIADRGRLARNCLHTKPVEGTRETVALEEGAVKGSTRKRGYRHTVRAYAGVADDLDRRARIDSYTVVGRDDFVVAKGALLAMRDIKAVLVPAATLDSISIVNEVAVHEQVRRRAHTEALLRSILERQARDRTRDQVVDGEEAGLRARTVKVEHSSLRHLLRHLLTFF